MRALCVSVVVLALAGCAGRDDDDEAPPPSSATMLRVYFVRGENVGAAARAVPQTQAVGASAVRQLLAGPSAKERAAGLVSSVPGPRG